MSTSANPATATGGWCVNCGDVSFPDGERCRKCGATVILGVTAEDIDRRTPAAPKALPTLPREMSAAPLAQTPATQSATRLTLAASQSSLRWRQQTEALLADLERQRAAIKERRDRDTQRLREVETGIAGITSVLAQIAVSEAPAVAHTTRAAPGGAVKEGACSDCGRAWGTPTPMGNPLKHAAHGLCHSCYARIQKAAAA